MSFVEGLVIIVLIFCVTMIAMMLIQKRQYFGKIVFEKDEEFGTISYTLEVDGDPYDIQHMKSVSFKVVKKGDIAD